MSPTLRINGKAPKSATRQTRRLLPVVRDLDIDMVSRATLNGTKVDARLVERIGELGRQLTITGANTLRMRVLDPERELIRADLLGRRLDLDLASGGRWRIDRSRDVGGISINERQIEFTFWDIASAALRGQTSPLAISSRRMDVGQYATYLAREVRQDVPMRVVCPNPGDVPPLEDGGSSGGGGGTAGFRAGVRLKGKVDDQGRSSYLTAAQLKVAAQILRVCDTEKATGRARLAAMMAALVESELERDETPDEYGSVGTYQPRVGYSRGPGKDGAPITKAEALDTELTTKQFVRGPSWTSWTHDGRLIRGSIEAARLYATMTAGEIAQKIEGSAHPGRYDKQRDHAQAIIDAWRGGDDAASGGSAKRPAQWRRGTEQGAESSWLALEREAKRLGRRRFVAMPWLEVPRLVVASDQQLIAAQPHLTVSGLDDALLTVPPTIELEGAAHLQTIELSPLLAMWSAPPGAAVEMVDTGPADGAWIVQSLDAPPGSLAGRVVLTKEQTKVEKQAEKSTAAGGKSGGSGGGSVGDRLYSECKRIGRRKLPYGPGGHGQAWVKASAAASMDCSSSTSVALHGAGLMPGVSGPQVSDWFLTWGKAGRGTEFTVWVKPGTGPNGHVWIEFHGRGRNGHRWDTGQVDDQGRGPRLRTTPRSNAGFTPRH